jgi:hypothetical protein
MVMGVAVSAGSIVSADEARAKAIVQQAVTAMGGAQKLSEVKELVSTGKLTLQTPMGELSGDTKTEVVFPDKFRSTIALPMGDVVQSFDGTTAAMTMGGQPMDLPPAMVNEMRRGITTAGGITLLLKALSGAAKVDTLPPAEVAGRKVDVITWKEGEVDLRASYDAETHLLARLEYTASTPQGNADVAVTVSDIRDVAGLKLPFAIAATQNGQRYMEMTVTDVKVNPGVDTSKFGKP